MATITAASGGGNWNATGSWTGGVVPGSGDDVILASTSGNITVTAAAACRSLSCVTTGNYTGTLTINSTFTLSVGTSTVNGSLALQFVSGMTFTNSGTLAFVSTSATQIQITTAGLTMGTTTFTGSGGSWLLEDTNTMGAVTHTAGTLNTNGKTCTWTSYTSTGSTTRVFTLGASTVTLTGSGGNAWNVVTTNFTFNANTSTVAFTGSSGTVVMTTPSLTFNNLTYAPTTAAATNILQITAGVTLTVSGTMTFTGAAAPNRVFVQTGTLGTATTISAATVSLSSGVDFVDITGSGAGSWNFSSSTMVGNCGGTSGITFPTAQTSYWSSNTGNWSTLANWYLASGGTGGAGRVPLPQDTANFDANSFSTTGKTITLDTPRMGTINCTGALHSPTLTSSTTTALYFYGSFTLVSGMAFTPGGGADTSVVFAGRSTYSITTAGVTLMNSGGNSNLYFECVTGTYTLNDNLALGTNKGLYLQSGTLTATANVTLGYDAQVDAGFTSNYAVASTLNMGSGTWTLNIANAVNCWLATGSGLTLNCQTSTISIGRGNSGITTTFNGGGHTYNTLTSTNAGAGTLAITGNNTFASLTIGSATTGCTLTLPAGGTQTVSSLSLYGNSTTDMTVGSSSTSATTISVASGTVVGNYLALSYVTAAGSTPFYAVNSTNNGNNTNWTFGSPPVSKPSGWGLVV